MAKKTYCIKDRKNLSYKDFIKIMKKVILVTGEMTFLQKLRKNKILTSFSKR